MLLAPCVCLHIFGWVGVTEWPPIGKIAAHSAYEMFSWYKYLIVSLFFSRGVARECVMLKPNTFFQLKLLVFHNFFSERPGEIPYLKKSH